MREVGHEYGVTTGRPRRVGWLDIPALRYATRYCCNLGTVMLLQYAVTELDFTCFPSASVLFSQVCTQALRQITAACSSTATA